MAAAPPPIAAPASAPFLPPTMAPAPAPADPPIRRSADQQRAFLPCPSRLHLRRDTLRRSATNHRPLRDHPFGHILRSRRRVGALRVSIGHRRGGSHGDVRRPSIRLAGEGLAETALSRLHQIRPGDAIRPHHHLRRRGHGVAVERATPTEVIRHEHGSNGQRSSDCSKKCSHCSIPLNLDTSRRMPAILLGNKDLCACGCPKSSAMASPGRNTD